MNGNLLTLEGVHTHIGAYHILHGVDLAIPKGQLTMLLGRNGAGKTTTLRTIMGLWQASQGRVSFAGRDITRLSTPQIADPAVERIKSYAGNPPAFDTMRALEAFFRQVYKPYGWLSDAQWRRITETSARRLPDGRLTPHYDPAMVQQFTHHPGDYLIWAHYDALEIPVLCLRGAESDLVLRDTTAEMLTRGPGAAGLTQVMEIEGCGHAPALNVPDQLERVAAFIDAVG